MSTINITIHPQDESQIEAVKAFMKALKIKFEISKDKPYNPEFVAKIRKSEKEFEKGEFTRVEKDDLQNFLAL
jgi:predicted adenine nucleotide alpha hydrolase (AANH) superfamily ATPase